MAAYLPNPNNAGNESNRYANGGGTSAAGTSSSGLQAADGSGLYGMMDQMSGKGPQVQGPDQGRYNYIGTQADVTGRQWQNQGDAAQNAQAAQINTGYQAANQDRMEQARGQMAGYMGNLQDVYAGHGPSSAQTAFQNMNDQAMRSQMAMANSARGGAAARAGAQIQAQAQAGQMGAQAAGQGAQIRAQEQLGALQQMGGASQALGNLAQGQYGLEQNAAFEQARLNEQQKGMNNQMSLGLYGLSAAQQQQQLAALQGYYGNSLNAQGLQLGANKDTIGVGEKMVSGAAGAMASMSDESQKILDRVEGQASKSVASSSTPTTSSYSGGDSGSGSGQSLSKIYGQGFGPQAQASQSSSNSMPSLWDAGGTPAESHEMMSNMDMGAAMNNGSWESDERAKSGIAVNGALADLFLEQMHPHSYRYKDPAMEPREATGGKYLGILAQDMERIPTIGHQLVQDTPDGKVVLTKPALSAALAGLGRLDERVRELEAKKGRK